MSQLPTRILPQLLRSIQFPTAAVISDRLKQLAHLYAVAPLQLREEAVDSGYSSEVEDDEFERKFAKDWLLLLLKRGDKWVEDAAEDEDEQAARMDQVEEATRLVASLVEMSASGAIHRPVLLPTSESTEPITITLLDALPNDYDVTAVGLQSWGASIIFARRMALAPTLYFDSQRPLRTLELGAGTGLLSLACAKLRQEVGSSAGDLIVATDFHPAVLDNLRINVADNFEDGEVSSVDVELLDWSIVHNLGPDDTLPPPFDQRFDVILAGDVVYRKDHALWLRSCVERLLVQPDDMRRESATFHLIAPLRPTHVEAIASITEVFPRASSLPPREEGDDWRIAITSTENLDREWGVGRNDELGYRSWTIQWC